jgi:hypothetical protein
MATLAKDSLQTFLLLCSAMLCAYPINFLLSYLFIPALIAHIARTLYKTVLTAIQQQEQIFTFPLDTQQRLELQITHPLSLPRQRWLIFAILKMCLGLALLFFLPTLAHPSSAIWPLWYLHCGQKISLKLWFTAALLCTIFSYAEKRNQSRISEKITQSISENLTQHLQTHPLDFNLGEILALLHHENIWQQNPNLTSLRILNYHKIGQDPIPIHQKVPWNGTVTLQIFSTLSAMVTLDAMKQIPSCPLLIKVLCDFILPICTLLLIFILIKHSIDNMHNSTANQPSWIAITLKNYYSAPISQCSNLILKSQQLFHWFEEHREVLSGLILNAKPARNPLRRSYSEGDLSLLKSSAPPLSAHQLQQHLITAKIACQKFSKQGKEHAIQAFTNQALQPIHQKLDQVAAQFSGNL